ncbi:MAG: cell division protein ZapA [Roseiarcus sp.]
MAQVSVNIGGRSYRLACNPGEEAHLAALAAALDRKIQEMRQAFGEIGDQRLAVMAALTIADEASEARARGEREAARAEAAETEARAAQAEAHEARHGAEMRAATLARDLDELTRRLDALAEALRGKADM